MTATQTKAQRETAVRYIVFILMLVGMLQVWARDGIKSFYSFSTPVVLFFHGQAMDGQIVSCAGGYEYRQRSRSSSLSRTIQGKTPLAKSSSGESAIGSYLYESVNKGWCERQIGKDVTMLIHPNDVSQNRISSFTQLWYVPFQLLLALFWVAIASRVNVLFWITLIFNGVIIPIILLKFPTLI